MTSRRRTRPATAAAIAAPRATAAGRTAHGRATVPAPVRIGLEDLHLHSVADRADVAGDDALALVEPGEHLGHPLRLVDDAEAHRRSRELVAGDLPHERPRVGAGR